MMNYTTIQRVFPFPNFNCDTDFINAAYGLSQNMKWYELLHFASIAGSLCCTKMGTRLGLATLDEVQTLIKKR